MPLNKSLAILSVVALSSCAALNPLDLLGSGVNTAANVQAGQTNNQTLGTSQSETKVFKVDGASQVEVSELDQSSTKTKTEIKEAETVNVFSGIPLWYWFALFIAAWVDSPKRWPGQIWRGWKRFRNRDFE